MKYSIISGSVRSHSQSIKVANYVFHYLKSQGITENIYILDFNKISIPFWDESFLEKGKLWSERWNSVSKELIGSDAFIIVTPEWGGMVPPALKNFFQLCVNKELYHKPALIISVSSGAGGVYPISELRMSSYKNTRICYLPEHVIVKEVDTILNDFNAILSQRDSVTRGRIGKALLLLKAYAEGFRKIRTSQELKKFPYPNGM